MKANSYVMTGLLVLLPACTPKNIHIDITAYADTSVIPNGFLKKKSFAVIGGSYVKGVNQNNELQTKELERKVSNILKDKEYIVTTNIEEADYCLFFNYGSSSETKVLNTLKYIPGETCTTTGTLGLYRYNQESATSGTYVYVPEEYTFHTKFLVCYVYDAKLCQNLNQDIMPPQIWYGLAYGVDEYTDLRKYLELLLVQLFDFFGDNSPGTVSTKASEDDIELQFNKKPPIQNKEVQSKDLNPGKKVLGRQHRRRNRSRGNDENANLVQQEVEAYQ